MEIYKFKWMVLGALGCMNNADFEKKKKINDNIVLDVLLFVRNYDSYVLKDLQSNPQSIHSPLPMIWKVWNTGFTMSKVCNLMF